MPRTRHGSLNILAEFCKLQQDDETVSFSEIQIARFLVSVHLSELPRGQPTSKPK